MSLECVDMYAPTPLIKQGQRMAMGADPDGKYFLYPSSKTIVIRNIEDPKKCDIYSGHIDKTTVAKCDLKGDFICSGDSKGNVRVWEAKSSEHKLKSEFPHLLNCAIADLDWDADSKRIVVCGNNITRPGKAIMFDSGNSVGDIVHASGGGNSITCKKNRPMRVALGTEGKEVVFYKGPPFKFDKVLTVHDNFVQSVRFSPNGNFLASACLSHRLFISDGGEAEKNEELMDGTEAHSAGINDLSWSPKSDELLSVSGDKTAKIWNIAKKECVVKFILGTEVKDQQLSCVWVGNHLLTVSLSGDINYLDRNNPSKPLKVIHGHNTEIVNIFVIDENNFLTGDSSGKILKWDISTGDAALFSGKGHTGKIAGLHLDANSNKMVTLGWDDKIRFTCLRSMDYSTSVIDDLESQPIKLCSAGCGTYVVLTQNEIRLIKNEKKVFSLQHEEDDYNKDIPTSIAAAAGRVAVGSHKNKVTIYSIENDGLEKMTEFNTSSPPTVMAFSRDGAKLAVACNQRLFQYTAADNYKKVGKRFVKHTSKIRALEWSPSGKFLASAAMDDYLTVWDTPHHHADIKFPHKDYLNDIAWLDDDRLLTCGYDGFTKLWHVLW